MYKKHRLILQLMMTILSFSGFTGNVDLSNSPAITVTCRNPTFVYSNSPIMIKSNKGIYGICLQRKCFGDNCKSKNDI